MSCLFPILLKDGWRVPCGRCFGCFKDYQNQWSFRLYQESKACDCARVYTFTYDDEHLPPRAVLNDTGLMSDYEHTLSKRDVQLFMKRLRKQLDVKGIKFKYFLVGEYGKENNRPHYHCMMFFTGVSPMNGNDLLYIDNLVGKIWDKGFSLGDYLSPEAINYCLKYLLKRDINNKNFYRYNHFMMCSKGMGLDFVDKNKEFYRHSDRKYVTRVGGAKQSIPRYYKVKMFDDLTEEEKIRLREEYNWDYNRRERENIEKVRRKHGYGRDVCGDADAYLRYQDNKKNECVSKVKQHFENLKKDKL